MDGNALAHNERVILPSGVPQRTVFEAINPYPNFMELKFSSKYQQQQATCSYPERNRIHEFHPTL